MNAFSFHEKLLLAAALAAAAFLLPGLEPAFGEDYEALASRIAALAGEQGCTRVAVDAFSAQGQAAPEEAARAQRLLSEALFKQQGIGVMDAEVLQKLKGRGRQWAQVLVKGGVYRTGEARTLVVKVASLGGQTEIFQIELSRPEPPSDFRDAPRAGQPGCDGAQEALVAANKALVDLKARYWAARVREPGFSYAALDSTPGSELRDYGTVQKFFALINAYYAQEAPVTLSGKERARVEELLSREKDVAARCGAQAAP